MPGEIRLGRLLETLRERREVGDIRPEAVVKEVVCDSRKVRGGSLFVAVKGPEADGHDYIPEAVKAGALAVVAERAVDGVGCILVSDSRAALGRLAQGFYGEPGAGMTKVAVTGTNGKTTFCYLLRSILEAAGQKVVMFGTTGHFVGDEFAPAGTTTPGPLELAKLMAEAREAGISYAVLEASSHALDQGRLEGMDFQVGVFTNLTGDHLDYHGTMDEYLAAKAKLFERLGAGATAVLNRGQTASEEFARLTDGAKLWYGLGGEVDVGAEGLVSAADGSSFMLKCRGVEVQARGHLPGEHNVLNSLAAAGAGLALGIAPKVIAAGIVRLEAVPGRLERVAWDGPFHVLVDYAHTHDALANVLRAVREITRGELIVVFGCGGDRDRTKRPKMAARASELADRIFVTSDNPRTEEPGEIIRQIMLGITAEGQRRTVAITDRKEAIGAALAAAGPGDVVLIAGKGHETYQIVGTQKRDFDDRVVAKELLEKIGTSHRLHR